MAIQTLDEMLNEAKKKKKKKTVTTQKPVTEKLQSNIPTFKDLTGEDLAPVKTTVSTSKKKKSEDKWYDGWFKKSKGNTSQAVKGTGADAGLQVTTGVVGIGETFMDFLASLSSGLYMDQQIKSGRMLTEKDLRMADKIREDSKEFIKKDLYDEKDVAKKILAGIGSGVALGSKSPTGNYTADDLKWAEQQRQGIKKYLDEDVPRYSVLDEKSHGLLQSAGQLGATVGLSALGVPWWLTTGATSFGGEMENALNQGATFEQAVGSSLISAGAEVLTEKISGGISFGGKTLDDGLTNILARSISQKGLRMLSKVGMDFAGEGAEEIVSQFMSRLGSSLYKEENLNEILFSEEAFDEYLTSFISGGVLGGTSSAVNVGKSAVKGTDVLTGYTANEQKVYDKVVNDLIEERGDKKLTSRDKAKIHDEVAQALEEGSIDIETIERTLGEDFTGYDSLVEESKEFEKLFKTPSGELSREQQKRLEELEAKTEGTTYEKMIAEARQNISKSAFSKLGKDSRLQESYFEESKRGQDFEADLSQYDEKQKEVYQRAIDSGILNNTKKTHKLVDLIAKVSAEKGVSFDFTNNQKLKESGFAVEGKRVNGFKNGNTITINMQSQNALNTVVGHEITHVLEGSPEMYNAFAESIKGFGEAKGIYQSMYDAAFENYKNIYKDMTEEQYKEAIEKEVVADLVGEYIFTDIDFVRNLSTQNRNVFEKVYDEIKYFLKKVTAGSDADRKLLKAKKLFEEVWRENVEVDEISDANTQYSIREEAPPKETGVAYKVFYVKDGKLYPPMVANPDGAETPMGVWLNADVGTSAPPSKTGRPQVKAGGKGTQGGSGSLAFRPGWHLGDLPRASQFDRVNPETGKKELFPENFVWAEVEYAKDVDYQEEAMSYGYTDKGKFRHAYAGLPRLPENGYYRYRTNPKPDTVPWVITGAMKVNRLLSDAEVNAILEENGVPPVHRQGGDVELEKFGFNNDGTVKYSVSDSDSKQLDRDYLDAVNRGDTKTVQRMIDDAAEKSFKNSVIRDDKGKLIRVYHGTNAEFTEFKGGESGRDNYFTPWRKFAEEYGDVKAYYINLENPIEYDEDFNQLNDIDEKDADGFIYLGEDMRSGVDQEAIGETEIVVFDSKNIKSADPITYDDKGNVIPLSKRFDGNNKDIRFSISNPVEEGRELVAVHNLSADKLMKTLELGAFPMPSIAVTKSSLGHSNFGDISFVFSKDTINPKNKKNKVYGADAWTPTFPRVEYEADMKRVRDIRASLKPLIEKIPERMRSSADSFVSAIEYNLDNYGGYEGIVERAISDEGMKQVYLAQTDNVVEDVVIEKEIKMKDAEISISKNIIESLGEDVVVEFAQKSGKDIYENYGEKIREVLKKSYLEFGLDEDVVQESVEKTNKFTIVKFLRTARDYINTGGVKVETDIDYAATRKAINSKIDKAKYEQWIRDTFSGIVKNQGISNGKDIFTPSGNRRSFSQTHYPVTADNIVKSMIAQSDDVRNVAGFNGIKSIRAVAVKEFKNIDDIRKSSDKLEDIDSAEYEAMNDALSKRLNGVIADILAASKRESWNQFIDMDNIGMVILDACKKPTTANIKKAFDGTTWKVTDEQVAEIKSIIEDVIDMPVNMFEAKPLRTVGFDEAEAVLVPSDLSDNVRQELTNRGLNLIEYEAGNETDRAAKLNELDDLKFSLANQNKGISPDLNGIYSRDVLRKDLLNTDSEDIAPTNLDIESPSLVQDEVIETPVQEVRQQDDFVEDYAPLTETEANVRDDRQIEEHYFPDDIAPEMEEEYNGEYADHIKPADPFYEKDIFEVGRDRKQKAYMYENPEVKPFFQEEARYMLGELDNSQKGERIYNDHLYYETNGESGIFGTKRHTSEEIAYLLDTFGYTYKDIAKGLKAIIEDNGKENNAISKRIEFLLDERLRLGYKDFWFGDRIPPNQEYINLLNEKQINEYNDEAFGNWVQNLTDEDIKYFTQYGEDIAPAPQEYVPVQEEQTPEQILYSLEESQKTELEEMDKKVDAVEEEDSPELSVEEQYSAKVDNYKNSIEGYNKARAEIEKAFDDVISQKQEEYNGLNKKNTKRAANLLLQIENLKLRKANNLTNIDARIERTQGRLDKLIADEDATKDRMYAKRRKETHAGIVNKIKSHFASKGLDLDTVLNKAKDLSTFSTVDNTPQRVMEKSLGYKEGQALADMTVNKVAQNETNGIRWVNGIVKELKQISKEYGIKPRSKESAAAQKFAEGYYVDENDRIMPYGEEQLAKEFPNARRREDIRRLANDPRIRKIYDDALDSINESRRKNNYREIPKRQNYFLHSMERSDIFSRLGTPFNPQDIGAADLPTDINGMTADFTPGQPYFPSANARKGYKTTYDLLGGVEKYVNSAKNQIFHIEDIQTLRALRNYIADMFGQAQGFEGLDEMSNKEVEDRIKAIQSNHLSSFAKFLNEEANIIAGKTSLIDRGLEGIIGRRGIKVVDTINKQVGSNMVGFNVSSALTNLVSGVQAMAKSNKYDTLKAFTQTVANRIGSIYGKTDGFTEENSGYVRRQGIERFSERPMEKVRDAGYFLMGAVDSVTSEFILRTKYNELTRKGMSSEQAHIEADKWAHRILGDRTIGQQPQLYNSKMLGLITKFQLEVRNQLDSQFYDTFQEAKATSDNNSKVAAKVGKTMFELAVLQHVFGTAFESVAGYNPAFDLIEVLMTVIGADDDEESEDTVLDNVEQGFLALLEDLPYTSTLTGGRIPIESALPIKELITGQNDYGQDKPRTETLKEIAPYYVLPTGYGQIKKTSQGLGMFDDDLPVYGSYTDSGNLRFPVDDTLENRVRAGLFGQYANENARDYFDNERDSLKEKQIQEYIDLDLPIREYWDYREGLKKQDKLEDKFEYISNLDVTTEQKNIMINNVVDRKEKVDMSNYDDFANYEGFDWYSKNTEKYNFLQENGVSYADYKADEKKKEQYDSDYSIYKKNPEKVAMSKAIASNFLEYRSYLRDLDEFRADKDSNGKSISGSAKAKKMAYIENLPLDAGQKMILHRSLFDSKSDKNAYNRAIIEYLDSRSDISEEEYVLILEELDMKVHSDGRVTW